MAWQFQRQSDSGLYHHHKGRPPPTNLNRPAPSPLSFSVLSSLVSLCSALPFSSPAGCHKCRLCVTQRKDFPCMAGIFANCPQGSADQIYPLALSNRTPSVYAAVLQRTTKYVQLLRDTKPAHLHVRLPNISCTYTDPESCANPLT